MQGIGMVSTRAHTTFSFLWACGIHVHVTLYFLVASSGFNLFWRVTKKMLLRKLLYFVWGMSLSQKKA